MKSSESHAANRKGSFNHQEVIIVVAIYCLTYAAPWSLLFAMTLASFHSSGIIPVYKEVFIIVLQDLQQQGQQLFYTYILL